MSTRYPREQMHRIRYTKLSPEQIAAKLAAASAPISASPLSDVLAGTTLTIVPDGAPPLTYRFADHTRLSVSEGSGAAVQAGYGALTVDGVVLFSHLMPRTARGYTVVVDRDTGLATVVETWFNGYEDNREVQRQVSYGYVERAGTAAPAARHGITNRIEGKGFYWKQDTGVETLEFYPTVLYSNFVELSRFGGELSFCSPSDYIRTRRVRTHLRQAGRRVEDSAGRLSRRHRLTRMAAVSARSDTRCRPAASKFSGSSHAANAAASAGHSPSTAAYHAVSRLRPL